MQEIAGADADESIEDASVILKMPLKKDLEAQGETQLVQAIINAGGFHSVAQKLGLRTKRRPNGFWEDLGNVDEVGC